MVFKNPMLNYFKPWFRTISPRKSLLTRLILMVVVISLVIWGSVNWILMKEDRLKLSLVEQPPREEDHAIIVCAHGAWSGTRGYYEYLEPDAWILDERWPLTPNEAILSIKAYMEILKKGLEELTLKGELDSHRSLLIISGGQTRLSAGPISEAWSYYDVARHNGWINQKHFPHVILEEYARDSFENLLFSLCRFYEVTRQYPKKVTVISLDFKKKRFEEVYRAAIGYPKETFRFVGIPLSLPSLSTINTSLVQFENDPYGCHHKALIEKRDKRNPFRRRPAYDQSCPQLSALLHYCGPAIYKHRLPWSS
jgi:hypothetical protein